MPIGAYVNTGHDDRLDDLARAVVDAICDGGEQLRRLFSNIKMNVQFWFPRSTIPTAGQPKALTESNWLMAAAAPIVKIVNCICVQTAYRVSQD